MIMIMKMMDTKNDNRFLPNSLFLKILPSLSAKAENLDGSSESLLSSVGRLQSSGQSPPEPRTLPP